MAGKIEMCGFNMDN